VAVFSSEETSRRSAQVYTASGKRPHLESEVRPAYLQAAAHLSHLSARKHPALFKAFVKLIRRTAWVRACLFHLSRLDS
jgi:hypothetical protein